MHKTLCAGQGKQNENQPRANHPDGVSTKIGDMGRGAMCNVPQIHLEDACKLRGGHGGGGGQVGGGGREAVVR